MNREIEIKKMKGLKKGDTINLKGENYLVEDFREIHSEDKGKKKDEKQFIFKKLDSQGHLKGKYSLIRAKNTGDIKFYKAVEKKENSKDSFKYQARKSFFSCGKIK